MNTLFKKSLLAVAIGGLFTASAVHATNGYFSDGTGAKSRGMGGAGVAIAQEAGSIATNPAAAVNMDPRMDVGIGLFSPKPRSYSISGNVCGATCSMDGAAESGSNYFGIPFYGQNFEIDSTSSWAVVFTALGGMNTNFSQNPFDALHPGGGTFGNLGIDLKQMTLSGVYAKKINQQLSLGASAGVLYQIFQARGLGGFTGATTSSNGAAVTNVGKDDSNGIALSFGMTYKVNKDINFGLAYVPKTNMSKFKKYAGLFAEQGDFDIPSNYTLGLSWQADPKILVGFDYKRIKGPPRVRESFGLVCFGFRVSPQSPFLDAPG